MSDALPSVGRLAGIDFGTVRVGVAITDPDQRLASPLENYTRRGLAADSQWLRQLVAQERVAGFVVGLPVHLSGDESAKSREARQFGQWIKELTGLPVAYFDERFTSAQAESLLLGAELTKKRRKQRLDMLAAQILLTAYLESPRDGGEPKAIE
jgi:putative pre-16S rRNA nuclease